VNNDETQLAWNYHNGTKHPNGIFLITSHSYDFTQRPIPYKIYKTLKRISLPLEKYSTLSTFDTISGIIGQNELDDSPDLQSLARILYFSNGITKTINFSGSGEFEFRAASCTGALYHIEIYLVCGDIPGLEAGVYHFDPKGMKLDQLRKGDFRSILVDATANDSDVKYASAILIYTDIFTRNSIKYRTREYRHAFWDCGTIIANTLAMCNSHHLSSKVIMGFVDATVNSLLDLNQEKEVTLALIPIGKDNHMSTKEPTKLETLNLKTEFLSNYDYDDPEIIKLHLASSLDSPEQVSSWQSKMVLPVQSSKPSDVDIILEPNLDKISKETPIETVILKRGSTRKFSRESISFEQLSTILHYSTDGVHMDYLQKYGDSLIDLYVIINSVENLKSGIYYFNKKRNSLEILKEGIFRDEAMHLGLDQDLPGDGSVCVFFMANLEKIFEKFGNRGYRIAQMEASIIGGRFYLAAYSQKIGATGLTFYDDDVTDFFLPHSHSKNTMFMIVLGKK
jgi:SagB-type dehydrogenase family enzyme